MRLVRVLNARKGSVLGARVGVAETRWARLRGLLGRPEPRPGEGLLLVHCRGVHTYGLTYGLDVLFLNAWGRVVHAHRDLPPGTVTGWYRRVRYALEVPVGTLTATATEVGDPIVWVPVRGEDGMIHRVPLSRQWERAL